LERGVCGAAEEDDCDGGCGRGGCVEEGEGLVEGDVGVGEVCEFGEGGERACCEEGEWEEEEGVGEHFGWVLGG